MTIDVDEEPNLPSCNSLNVKDNKEDELIFSLAADKENTHPNLIEATGGRLSLQPQPLGGLNSPG